MKKASIDTARIALENSSGNIDYAAQSLGVDYDALTDMLKDVVSEPAYTPPKHPTDPANRPCPDPWDEPIPYRLTEKGARP